MSRGCFGGDGQSGIQCEFGEVSCCELGKESLCSGVQNLIMVSGAEVIDDFVGTIGQEVEECVILVFFVLFMITTHVLAIPTLKCLGELGFHDFGGGP